MRVRAKANGNVVDVPDTEAQVLINTGIYEAVDTGGSEDEPPPVPNKPARKYRRRDMTAE